MIPLDYDLGFSVSSKMDTFTNCLDKTLTQQLSREVPKAYRTEIMDILLSALLLAIGDHTGTYKCRIDLEGHGREEIEEEIDLSRVVGWFTSIYPVFLESERPDDLSLTIKSIKEQLRAIPDKGIGFGILKYFSPKQAVNSSLHEYSSSQLSFNYLGQWRTEQKSDSLFSILSTSSPWDDANENQVSHLININAEIIDECLKINWSYSKNHFKPETLNNLANTFLKRLKELIHHCCYSKQVGYTPSDFPLAALSQEQLDRALSSISDLEDFYPLSPLQEGLLFHYLSYEHSDTYFIQTGFEFKGDLSILALQKAWQTIIKRHPILRTGFLWDNLERPLQFVLKDVDFLWRTYDWQDLPETQQKKELESYLEKDRKMRYDLCNPPLMRLALFQLSSNKAYMVWSFHHLILDGWSTSLLLNELLACYASHVEQKTNLLSYINPFKSYIEKLQQKSLDKAKIFWKKELSPLPKTALLKDMLIEQSPSANYLSIIWHLSEEESELVKEFARKHQFTLSTVIQYAWAVAFSKYFQEKDFIFGITISGRSIDLPKIDQMVGLFINTLPFRYTEQSQNNTLISLRILQEKMLEFSEFSYVPLSKIQSWCGAAGATPLFDHIFVFENYPFNESIGVNIPGLEIRNDLNREQTEYPLTLSVTPGKCITFQFIYDTRIIGSQVLNELGNLLKNVLRTIVRFPERRVAEIDALNSQETTQILYELGNMSSRHASEMCMHQLFENQCEKAPDKIALISEELHITYRELNTRSNQLAHHLIVLGVDFEKCVAICAERSVEFIIAILAVLKSGGAYVPLDPHLPPTRLSYILQDSNACFLLTQSKFVNNFLDFKGKILGIEQTYSSDLKSLGDHVSHHLQLAYLLYTSGSTGKPKGVAIQHQSVANCIVATEKLCQVSNRDRFLAMTSLSFDVAVLDYFLPLSIGGCSVIVNEKARKNPSLLISLMQNERITCMQATPSACKMLSFMNWQVHHKIKMLIAGEKLPHHISEELLEKGIVFNIYGPTEGTIYATGDQISPHAHITIGRPLQNIYTMVLDNCFSHLPKGAFGELYLGGVCLARGYWNKSELTAERFPPNPFGMGSRLYKTGDEVRYLFDGKIDYSSRLDDQIKLRGFRIELGEIESVLQQHPGVQNAAVVVKENLEGQKNLVAYFVKYQKEVSTLELKQYLNERLPEYMVPAFLVPLDSIPITATGKVDRQALPAPDYQKQQTNDFYVSPRTEIEQILQQIWSELLGIERISIYDNFFEIGGDSIISIQMLSKARQSGICFELKEILKSPTIEKLALVSIRVSESKEAKKIQDDDFSGEIPLTPIQHWFFEQNLTNKNYYNQSVILIPRRSVDPVLLNDAFQIVVRHHNIFQFRFFRGNEGWKQSYSPYAQGPLNICESVKVAGSSNELIEKKIQQLESSLDIQQGPLIRSAIFDKSEKQLLFIVIHHLIIDGVSWRILIDDLETVYNAMEKQLIPTLPSKSNSYRQWSLSLQQYLHSEELRSQIGYWMGFSKKSISLPPDIQGTTSTYSMTETVTAELDSQQTFKLLHDASKAFHTHVNDLLLTALVQAFGDYNGIYSLFFDLEGHGREALDLSRTIGWFTSIFPVSLNLDKPDDIGCSIKQIKEQIRKIPQKGMGYGVFKYLSQEFSSENLSNSQISFNYLGQWDVNQKSNELFQLTQGISRFDIDRSNQRSHLIDINCEVIEDDFKIYFSYSNSHYYTKTIENLAQNFIDRLKKIIDYCCHKDSFGYTPSDFPMLKVNQEQLDRSIGKFRNVENAYALSPMQESMLFRARFQSQNQEYIIQSGYEIKGHVELEQFKAAWEEVFFKHPILRTAFCWTHLDEPIQYIISRLSLPFTFSDLCHMPEEKQKQEIVIYQYKERALGFNLERPPLIRMHLFKLSHTQYYFVWSCHHILLDGWSLQIIFSDFQKLYHQKQDVIAFHPPFENYIGWLQHQDKNRIKDFWQEYLQGLHSFTHLGNHLPSGPIQYDYLEYEMSHSDSETIRNYAFDHQLTLNSILLGLWTLLAYRIVQHSDFVLGITVSGRSIELNGVDEMVGLFINTLPLRIRSFNEGLKIDEFFRNIQEDVYKINQYAHLNLAEIKNLSLIDEEGHALFDHIFIFENYPLDKKHMDSHSFTIKPAFSFEKTEFPLTVCVIPEEKILFQFSFNTQFFDKEYLRRIIKGLTNILNQFVYQNVSRLEQFCLASKELNYAVVGQHHPVDKSVLELFEEQAAKKPDAIAVICGEEYLSFRTLNKKSNQLARRLRMKGITPDRSVGLLLERSPEMIIGILGILKAGGAYVPLDKQAPIERIKDLIQDAGLQLILTDSENINRTSALVGNIINLDQEWNKIEFEEATNPRFLFHPLQLAYIIYTSGSTGRPKGVLVSHQNFIHSLKARFVEYPFKIKKFLLLLSITFDTSNAGIFWSLLQGSSLVLLPESNRHVQAIGKHFLQKYCISHLFCVPSLYSVLLQQLSNEELLCLEEVILGGEVLESVLVEKHKELLRNVSLFNEYGPTEGTVWSTFKEIYSSTLKKSFSITIGKPIANVQISVMDSNSLQFLPSGFKGEMYIGGEGLARGYLNHGSLTAQQFIPNALPSVSGQRLYRTGDVAKLSPEGEFDYMGRLDHQVKIRGYRIELEEIEHVLRQEEEVESSVVLFDKSGNHAGLTAYLVHKNQSKNLSEVKTLIEKLRSSISQKLPNYMIPSEFILIDAFPLTAAGKIDRTKLPKSNQNEEVHKDDNPPKTAKEHLLKEIWVEILHKDHIGMDDNFFHIGGHSLLVVRLVAKIQQRCQLELPISDIFDFPTISSLAKRIESRQTKQSIFEFESSSEDDPSPLSFAQHRLWFLDQLNSGEKGLYNISLPLRIYGPLNRDALVRALQSIFERHAILRTSIESERGIPYQKISQVVSSFPVSFEDISYLAENDKYAFLQKSLHDEAYYSFDFSKDSLLRIKCLTLAHQETVLMITMHHIISDEWSMGIFIDELSHYYHAYLKNKSPSLPKLTYQYRDFARWQKQWLEGGVLKEQLAFWKRHLRDVSNMSPLPYDKPRPSQLSYKGASLSSVFSSELVVKINEFCVENDVTPFMFLLAIFKVLLYRYSNQTDIVVGTPVANRHYPNVQELIGLFVNTLAIPSQIKGHQNFKAFLKKLRETVLRTFEHQDVPFEHIVEDLKIEREINRHPIFQAFFIYHVEPPPVLSLEGLEINVVEIEAKIAKFDLTLMASLIGENLIIEVEYSTDLFEPNTIKRLLQHFEIITRSILSQPERPLGTLTFLTDEETQTMQDWNET